MIDQFFAAYDLRL